MRWAIKNVLDVLIDVTGGNLKIKQSEYLQSGRFPIVDQGRDLVGGYTDDESKLCSSDLPVIIFGDHTKHLKYIDFPFCLGADGAKVLKAKDGVDPKYLYYALGAVNIPDAGYSRHFKYLKDGRIPLPPLEEQKRIAGILDQADALRRLRARALEKLNTLGQAVFQETFGDPATNPRSLPKLRIASAVSKISDGPFGSNLKSEHYTDAGVRVWRLQNITARGIDNSDQAFISEEHYNTISKHTCFPGDVIVATLGDPNLRACIQPSSVSRAINKADCVQIRPNNDVAIAEFWEGLINHPGMIALSHSEIHGQTRARISMGRLREICVPIPDIEDQYIYRDRVAGISILISKADEAVKESNALFASLQSAAFQGRL